MVPSNVLSSENIHIKEAGIFYYFTSFSKYFAIVKTKWLIIAALNLNMTK